MSATPILNLAAYDGSSVQITFDENGRQYARTVSANKIKGNWVSSDAEISRMMHSTVLGENFDTPNDRLNNIESSINTNNSSLDSTNEKLNDMNRLISQVSSGIKIYGETDSVNNLPSDAEVGACYLINSLLYIKDINGNWINLGSFKGPQGDPGTGLKIDGVVDTEAQLPTPTDPDARPAYLVGDDIYLYDNITKVWKDAGPVRGPKGDTALEMFAPQLLEGTTDQWTPITNSWYSSFYSLQVSKGTTYTASAEVNGGNTSGAYVAFFDSNSTSPTELATGNIITATNDGISKIKWNSTLDGTVYVAVKLSADNTSAQYRMIEAIEADTNSDYYLAMRNANRAVVSNGSNKLVGSNMFDKDKDTIGGRNLLQGTSGTLQTVTNASGYNTNLPTITPVVTTINSDTTYTARAWVAPSSHDMQVQVVWIDSSGTTHYEVGNIISAGTSEYSTWTGTITSGSTINCVTIVFHSQQSTNSTVSYKEMKLEKGSVATDWTPAPEDVNQQLDKKVNTADMRKPASDVMGLEDAPQAVIKAALDNGVDLHTVTAPGIYPFNGCTFVNDMNSDTKWGFLIVTNVGNEVVLQQMIQGNNQVYGQCIYDGGNNIWSDWSIQNKTSIINRSSDSIVDIYTDKAIYSPGDNLKLSIEHTGAWSNVNISVYEYCNLIFSDSTITMPNSPAEYIWSVPDNNHVGYMIKVTITDFNGNNSSKFIGVNVCANPWEAPIYGFLGNFDSSLNTYKQKQIVRRLNRKHVNYVQFYDWYDRDDTPLRLLDTGMPETYWQDYMKRETLFSKVKKYIDICHDNGMLAMFYNLIYGSQLGDPSSTDPQLSWTNPNLTKEMFLYKDTSATTPYSENDTSYGGKINITYMNCLNSAWRNYLSGQSDVVYAFLPFDGWHVDQLGSLPSDTYSSDGFNLDWANFGEGYGGMLRTAKNRHPDKQVTFNDCDDLGTDSVVKSNATDFLYTEVWSGIGESFSQLASYIQANITKYKKPLVLAAYVNKQKAEGSDHGDGMINDTAPKLCDALIMSNGASHLEWGEHYLANEYFPNNSLTLRDTTEQVLTNYSDVYVAYLQMLNGTTWNSDTVASNTHSLSKDFTINNIAYVEKNSSKGKILSLINLIGLAHDQWRDTNGTQVAPTIQTNIQISIATADVVKSVWLIKADQSPEAVQIDFSQNSSSINFEIDKLEIFDMIILKNN